MNKNWIFGVIFLLSLFSCSNNEQKIVMVQSDDTIKTEIKKKEEKINWTNEIEGDVLTQTLNDTEVFSSSSLK